MIKFTGIILVSICPVIFGYIMSSRVILAEQQLITIVKLIQLIRGYILYESVTVDEILQRVSDDKQFEVLFENSWQSCNDKNRDKQISDFIKNISSLYIDKTDVKNLIYFFEGLGASDVSGQLNHCDLYKEQFNLRVDEVKKFTQTKRKLYSSLGIYAGLLIVVIMI